MNIDIFKHGYLRRSDVAWRPVAEDDKPFYGAMLKFCYDPCSCSARNYGCDEHTGNALYIAKQVILGVILMSLRECGGLAGLGGLHIEGWILPSALCEHSSIPYNMQTLWIQLECEKTGFPIIENNLAISTGSSLARSHQERVRSNRASFLDGFTEDQARRASVNWAVDKVFFEMLQIVHFEEQSGISLIPLGTRR